MTSGTPVDCLEDIFLSVPDISVQSCDRRYIVPLVCDLMLVSPSVERMTRVRQRTMPFCQAPRKSSPSDVLGPLLREPSSPAVFLKG